MRISDWSSDVCSSDLAGRVEQIGQVGLGGGDQLGHADADQAVAPAVGLLRQQGARRPVQLLGHLRRAYEAARARHQLEVARLQLQVNGAAGEAGLLQAARHLLAERRSEEHTSELQSLMRISYAVFCLKKKKQNPTR